MPRTRPPADDQDPCVELTSQILNLMGQLKKLPRHSAAFDEMQRQIVALSNEANDLGCPPIILHPPPPPPPASLRWEPVSSFAIQRGPAPASDPLVGPYHAGHVNDILVLPATSTRPGSPVPILIGTDSGGVWLHVPGNSLEDGDFVPGTSPLSDHWNNPDVLCLAQGIDADQQVYAGCSKTLYESADSGGTASLSSWRDLDPGVGTIYRIGVLKDARRIVLATSTGIFWSPIPALGGAYSWKSAQWPNLDPLFASRAYSGLALGPAGSIAVGAFGHGSGFGGIFSGAWTTASAGSQLLMHRSTVNGASPTDLFRTSLASGADGSVMYAVAAGGNSWIFGVFKSTDGGLNWSKLKTQATALNTTKPFPPGTPLESAPPATDVAGGQGYYNNCIAVSPVDSKLVLIGWRNGPWLSTDGGLNWVRKHADDNPHLHSDLHCVYFDPNEKGSKIYVGSDGGVVATVNQGDTFDSSINRRLLNLQFQSQPARQFYGRFTASASTGGLIGGGLQDNGNVYLLKGAAWRQLDGGDGQMMMFFPAFSPHNLLRYNNDGIGVKSSILSVSQFNELGVIQVAPGKPGVSYPKGLQGGALIVESVRAPQFRHAGSAELMLAVAGLDQDVYGLFANTVAGTMHWEYLATVPLGDSSAIWAIGSGDGNTIFSGSQDGRIFASDPRDGSSVEQNLPPLAMFGGSVFRIVICQTGSYAILNTRLGGSILRANGRNWEPLSGGLPSDAFYALEAPFRLGNLLFAATDDRVYMSKNSGDTWVTSINGLPRRAHCADLRHVEQEDGKSFLYLSTFGRSAWALQM